jgi:GNAT superfamily N-acetyltransferase
MVTVFPVRKAKDVKRFIKLLWLIYRGDPNWVPPIKMDRKQLMDVKRNPFYKHADVEFFLAYKNGKIVGRIAAIINRTHNEFHNEHIGHFGFFESINDPEVSAKLFEAVKLFFKARGISKMLGPMNPSTNDECGLLVDGFDFSPMVLMTYNPRYYLDLFEAEGLQKTKDLYAYFLEDKKVMSEKLVRVSEMVKKREDMTFRTLNMKDFRNEIQRIQEIYNDAWEKNWGFVPMNNEEFSYLAKQMKTIVVPELVIIAEKNSRPIGFALSLPDINIALKYNTKGTLLGGVYQLFRRKKEINQVRIITLGVVKDFRNSGAASVLFYETARRAIIKGYTKGEASWILEDNVMMNRSAEMLNATRYKTYRMYEKNF